MSVTVSRGLDTRLGQAFAVREAAHPGESGVAILDYGPLAFLSRTALADLADRTIDVQYYIYEADRSGLVLLQRLKAAADRGVRVRILIDDNNLAAQDVQLAQFAGHPNVQVRVFNPFRNRVPWTRPLQYLTDFSRANRRMHNKIFAVDNRAVIIGGRNVGDNYFNLDAKSNFTDFDLLVVGPAVEEASKSFDEYWNSEWAVPAAAFTAKPPTAAESAQLFKELDDYVAAQKDFEVRFPRVREDFVHSLMRTEGLLTWAQVEIISDPPEKIDAKRAPDRSVISQRIYREIRAAREELLIESAYFVPRRGGVRMFKEVRDRGADVRILTNSLASNDVPLVHAGYQKHRRDLLAMGVEVHEFQLQAGASRAELRLRKRPSSEASLHSKAMVFDRRAAYVGSFNLDPRSARLNTEIGVFVKSDQVASQLATKFADDFSPSRSWRLELEPAGIGGRRRLVWIGERNGEILRLYRDPDTTAPLRAFVSVMAFFPGLDYLL